MNLMKNLKIKSETRTRVIDNSIHTGLILETTISLSQLRIILPDTPKKIESENQSQNRNINSKNFSFFLLK